MRGHYAPPTLQSVETCLRYGLSLGRSMRVTADLWDIESFVHDDDGRACVERIAQMNQAQAIVPGAS